MPAGSSPRVSIIYGSPSDQNVMRQAGAMLARFGVSYDEVSISAHRAPRALADWMAELEPRGVEAVIAGAGMSAALPGVVAAHTILPVIGVPIRGGAMDGLDALLAITQMPPGVPVACVGMDNAKNAAVLAVQIMAVHDPALRVRLAQFKDDFEKAAVEGLGGAGTGELRSRAGAGDLGVGAAAPPGAARVAGGGVGELARGLGSGRGHDAGPHS